VSLQVAIGARLRELRDELGLTQEQLAKQTGLSAEVISRIENGHGNPTAETLERVLAGLDVSARGFFTTARFGSVRPEVKLLPVDDGRSVQVEFRTSGRQRVATILHLSHTSCEHSLRQLWGDLARTLSAPPPPSAVSLSGERAELTTVETQWTDAVARAYYPLVARNARVNPSDVWWYFLRRLYLDAGRNPLAQIDKDLEGSWKKVSGVAFERVVDMHYCTYLENRQIELVRNPSRALFLQFGVTERAEQNKVDRLACHVRSDGSRVPFAIVNFKSSIAERWNADQSHSRRRCAVFITLDAKDDAVRTDNPGEYGRPLVRGALPDGERGWTGSPKRHSVEVRGIFSAVFSFNTRTLPTPDTMKARSRIHVLTFADRDDAFSQYLIQQRDRVVGSES
jgi:transcriptional regulator with XRE-family HTH domain